MADRQKRAAAGTTPAQSPYGGGPGKGITLPPYYRPTPGVKNLPGLLHALPGGPRPSGLFSVVSDGTLVTARMGLKVLEICASINYDRQRFRRHFCRVLFLTDAQVAAMFKDTCPVQWTGRQAVVALPEHIDASNVGQIREQLLVLVNRGAAVLIADMTATVSCDHGGADALLRAYHRASVNGAQLRLVVTTQIVRRVLDVSGLDRLVSIYPSLEAAIAAGGAGSARPAGARTSQGARRCQGLLTPCGTGAASAAGYGAAEWASGGDHPGRAVEPGRRPGRWAGADRRRWRARAG